MKAHVAGMKDWRSFQSENIFCLCYYSSRSAYPLCTIDITQDLSYTMKSNGRVAGTSGIGLTMRDKFITIDDINTMVSAVESATICQGCDYTRYQQYVEQRLDGAVFRNGNGDVIATLEDLVISVYGCML